VARETLNLHLMVDRGREADCADALLARLSASEFRILAALAAELASRHEVAVNGSRVFVVPAEQADAVLAELCTAKWAR